MTVYVNNEPRELAAHATLHQLLETCQLPSQRGIAVAVNNRVVVRAAWEIHPLQAGDKVMLIRASKGG